MIRLLQYLCEKRHATMGALYDDRGSTSEQTQAHILGNLKAMGADPWCGLCLSTTFHFEDNETPFPTIKAAVGPALKSCLEQLATRREMDRSKRN